MAMHKKCTLPVALGIEIHFNVASLFVVRLEKFLSFSSRSRLSAILLASKKSPHLKKTGNKALPCCLNYTMRFFLIQQLFRCTVGVEQGEGLKINNIISVCSVALCQNCHFANYITACLLNEIFNRRY